MSKKGSELAAQEVCPLCREKSHPFPFCRRLTHATVQAAAHVFTGKEPHEFGPGSGINNEHYRSAYQYIQRLMNVPPTTSTIIILAGLTNAVISLVNREHFQYSPD